MKKLLLSFIGLVIIGLVGIFILKTGNCGMLQQQIPFELKGTVYYATGTELICFTFKTFPKMEIIKKGWVFGTLFSKKRQKMINLKNFRNLHMGLLSLSPDEDKVAFYSMKNKLGVIYLKEGKVEILAEDCKYAQPVWISNNELLYSKAVWKPTNEERDEYITIDGPIIKININTKQKIELGYKGIWLGALSPNKQYVICTRNSSSWESCAIYLLHVPDMKLTKFARCPGLIITCFIWSPDGKYFIFKKSRHPLISLLHGAFDIQDLYVYSLEHKKAYCLIENTSLFDGFWLEECIELEDYIV